MSTTTFRVTTLILLALLVLVLAGRPSDRATASDATPTRSTQEHA